MKYSFAPDLFRDLLIESLQDETDPAYGQIATLNPKNEPEVRTVHLRYIPEYETIGFVCHEQSKKMFYLKEHHQTSGCWYDRKRKMQFRWSSPVELVKEGPTRERMWNATRETVRLVYGTKDQFVSVVLKPIWWDFYVLKSEDYREHERYDCKWDGKKWNAVRIHTLTGKPL